MIYNGISTPFYSTKKLPDDDIDHKSFYNGPLTDDFPNGFGFGFDYIGEWRMGIMEGYGQKNYFGTKGTYVYVGKFNFLYISF